MKYRYSVDSDNQLLIRPSGSKTPIKAKGKFGMGLDNQLIFALNEPSNWRRQYKLGSRIAFKGRWALNANHDLELALDETKEQDRRDRLALKGEIISCIGDSLAFEIISRANTQSFQVLTLSGSWQADAFNRLTFLVKKDVSPDTLTFESAWQLNKNQQLIYKYEKINLKTRTKTAKTLIFEGFWEISGSHRLTYLFSRSSESRFDFRVQIGTPNQYPQNGVLKYKVGIGLKKTLVSRIIYLYGAWKFSRNLSLIFEMDYGEGRIHALEFGAVVHLNPYNKIAFILTDRRGEPIGFNLTFTHTFLKKIDAQAYLKLKGKLSGIQAVEAGLQVPF
jgi:hypothetical protein